jgi:hypothetical protein
MAMCPQCGGRGTVGGPGSDTGWASDRFAQKCPNCGGTGKDDDPSGGPEDLLSSLFNSIGNGIANLFKEK